MPRLRKAARLWRDPEARADAARVIVPGDGPLFTVDPAAIFTRAAPLEIEIGAGRGDFAIDYAAAHPDRNLLAIELAASVARVMAVRAARRGAANLRVLIMDARPLVRLMLPERSVARFHIYFPDPWPRESQQKHRLFSAGFAAGLYRTAAENGAVSVATDFEPYASEIFATLEGAGFRRVEAPVPGARLTGFARKFIAAGRQIFAGEFVPDRDHG